MANNKKSRRKERIDIWAYLRKATCPEDFDKVFLHNRGALQEVIRKVYPHIAEQVKAFAPARINLTNQYEIAQAARFHIAAGARLILEG